MTHKLSTGRSCLVLAALLTLSTLALAPAAAQAEDVGLLTSFLSDLDRLEGKMVPLAEAVPADMYGWRPAEGIRSVSEVYMHMAGSMQYILSVVGTTPVADLEKVTDKDQVVSELKKAFAATREAVGKVTAAELGDKVQMFGREWTKADIIYLVGTHNHEHLGQSIAYARSIGVVPPWSQ
jgi:uncharacterized damage-inducible protein DinB